MKTTIIGLTMAALALTAVRDASSGQEMKPTQASTSAEHAWLLQLVGDWRAEWGAEPGKELESNEGDEVWKSTETVRAIGDLWIVAEGTSSTKGGGFSSMLTIGYDPSEKAFVGSWVDSMQTRMWTYRGTLDEDKRVLTLAAQGPSMTDPTKTGEYEDRLELVTPDHKRITSFGLGEDGTWKKYMEVNYKRVKKD